MENVKWVSRIGISDKVNGKVLVPDKASHYADVREEMVV
jgi:hypothetical protein